MNYFIGEKMKTNISIELDHDQRLNLGQKYHNTEKKKLITRRELNILVKQFVQTILEGSTETISDDFKYFFNDVGVSENTWEKGIETWLKVLKARRP